MYIRPTTNLINLKISNHLMQLQISKEMSSRFPGLNIGVVIAKEIDNNGKDEKIYHLVKEVEDFIKLDFVPEKSVSIEKIKKHIAKHKLISVYRAAYYEMHKKPTHYHTNVERLMATVLKGKKIPKENKLQDCINYISLKNIVPVSGFDLGKVKEPITLGIKKEVLYYDKKGSLTSRWNWKQARAEITKDTKNAMIVVDGLPPVTKNKVNEITNQLKEVIDM